MSYYGLIRRFYSNQRGNVIIIAAAAFVLIITGVGGAIDLSRYLVAKTQAQAALDNALLSATAVRTTQDVTDGVNRFFDANFPSTIAQAGPVAVTFPEGDIIRGEVDITLNTFFGAFVGFDTYTTRLLAETSSTAGGPGGTEIVLTLDNSPSMCFSSPYGAPVVKDPACQKLTALKNAVTSFVNTVLDENPANIAIGLVPFNHHVRMHTSMPPELGPVVRIDGLLYNDGNPSILKNVQILELTNDRNALLNRINEMNYAAVDGWGFTRTNVGTAVAGLMLMPYPQDTAHFNHNAGLPGQFEPGRRDKIMILMTDGENVTSFEAPRTRDSSIPRINDVDDNHQAELCRIMKEQYGMLIYSVVFDMPNNRAKDIFRNCATNEQFFFDVSSAAGLQLAYETTAQSINRVRLRR